MKKTNLMIAASISFALTLAPVSSSVTKLIGQSNVAEAKKAKPLTQQEFNKKVAELGRAIKEYNANIKYYEKYLAEYRSENAMLFGSLFEDETVDLTEKELVEYYLNNISSITDDSSILADFLESYEIDEISTYIDDAAISYKNSTKLKAKIKEYEAKYKAAVKAKSFDQALKLRTDQVKFYEKLDNELNNAYNAEYDVNLSLTEIVDRYNEYLEDNSSDEVIDDSEEVIDDDFSDDSTDDSSEDSSEDSSF